MGVLLLFQKGLHRFHQLGVYLVGELHFQLAVQLALLEGPAQTFGVIATICAAAGLLACGIREVLLDEVFQRNIPLSHKKLSRALKAITRSESYLCAMKAGACRYDTEGYVTEHITQEEEQYAQARLEKVRRQNRIKDELRAILAE